MSLAADLDAVRNNAALAVDQKRAAIIALKADAWRTAIIAFLPYVWQTERNGRVWRVRLTSVSVDTSGVTLDGVLRRDGVVVTGNPPIFPLVIDNPPIRINRVAGEVDVPDIDIATGEPLDGVESDQNLALALRRYITDLIIEKLREGV